MEKNKIYSLAIALCLLVGGGMTGYFANTAPECPICTPCAECPICTPCAECPICTPCDYTAEDYALVYDAYLSSETALANTSNELSAISAEYTEIEKLYSALQARYDALFETANAQIINLNQQMSLALWQYFNSGDIYEEVPEIVTGTLYTMTIQVSSDWKDFQVLYPNKAYITDSVTVTVTYYMPSGNTESVTYDFSVVIAKSGFFDGLGYFEGPELPGNWDVWLKWNWN